MWANERCDPQSDHWTAQFYTLHLFLTKFFITLSMLEIEVRGHRRVNIAANFLMQQKKVCRFPVVTLSIKLQSVLTFNTDPSKPGKPSLTCSRKEHWFLPHRLIFSKVLLACDFAVSPSSVPAYSQACHCVCLAGQARRRSEEEQGDEGGGLPVDERTRGKRTHQFRELKKKKTKKKKPNNRAGKKRKWTQSDLERFHWCGDSEHPVWS